MPLAMMVNDSIQDLTSLDKPANEGDEEAGAATDAFQKTPPTKEPEEANPQQPPSFRYAGQFEYSEDYYFHPFSLTPTTGTIDSNRLSPTDYVNPGHHIILSSKHRSSPGGLLGCLFPWWFGQANGKNGVDDEIEDEVAGNKSDDGSASNNSNMLGEKLSQRERQAVLNRLRLPADTKIETRKNLLNGIPVTATSPLEPIPRGPLKGILKHQDSTHPPSTATANSPPSPIKAAAENSNRRSLFPTTYEKRTNKAVSFAPMARVITVKSKNDMDAEEKASIWWQRPDYEDFRRTGRIITKNNNAGLLSDEEKAPDSPIVDHKWWHSFGHSRRGLEHVVSIDEGRQRQQNVKAAIQAVLKEQTRSTTDSEKLRAVALTYTAWARDLALAAGASDADAVVRGFGEDRRSREFFLLKQQKQKSANTIVPNFMQPRTKTSLQQRMLDANISRRKRPSLSTKVNTTMKEDEPSIDVHDSMAQKAAGFAADGKKHDMAAVLAGAATAVN